MVGPKLDIVHWIGSSEISKRSKGEKKKQEEESTYGRGSPLEHPDENGDGESQAGRG